MPRRRKVTIGETRVAGTGADGNDYGVTTLSSKGMTYRRKPCATCPWRKDAEVGRFPAQAFRESANTAFDMATRTFACHEAGTRAPSTCAGFLLCNSRNNLAVRLALANERIDLRNVGNPDDVPLFESYRAMAVANGVDPDDPAIESCRSDNDEWKSS